MKRFTTAIIAVILAMVTASCSHVTPPAEDDTIPSQDVSSAVSDALKDNATVSITPIVPDEADTPDSNGTQANDGTDVEDDDPSQTDEDNPTQGDDADASDGTDVSTGTSESENDDAENAPSVPDTPPEVTVVAPSMNATEAYLPPADVATLDLGKDDPSTDVIKFTYAPDGRISECFYKANGMDVVLSYAYDGSKINILGITGSIITLNENFSAVGEYDPTTGFVLYNGYYFKGFKFN